MLFMPLVRGCIWNHIIHPRRASHLGSPSLAGPAFVELEGCQMFSFCSLARSPLDGRASLGLRFVVLCQRKRESDAQMVGWLMD